MAQEIKRTQLGAQALLRGGWSQLTESDYGVINSRVKEQLDYLHNFTEELRAGSVRTDGQFFNRARLYPAASRVGYHEDERPLMTAEGYREEHNILHPAEHCSQCVECWVQGWVPIGTLPLIGSRQCFGNDRCTIRYR
jgi:hypothetical protein